ncbi:hypothetical protein [Lichenicoccus sp.]|uniref:hypothetical protein n=1 Tax=Lichenicoccus sp. TaxID=2781899 RepID=UPI003D0D58F3
MFKNAKQIEGTMHFLCPCGHVIRDQTDCLPYKARYVADQDYADLDRMTAEQIDNAYWDYHREMYQCQKCGRLFLEDQHSQQLLAFKPEDHDQVRALGSIRGREYKVSLEGNWYKMNETPGVLKWGDSGDLLGASERFDQWDDLQRRYFEIKDVLTRENRLRYAQLRGPSGLVDSLFVGQDE